MNSFRLEVPAIQNWNCHGCTDCCRDEFVVTLSDSEKRRIESQGWTLEHGVDPEAIFQMMGNQTSLRHQDDGRCVFLDDIGHCRIHARFGEAAKPLACRLYPLTLHPAGNKLLVGLRFSCPSAVGNRGKAISGQLAGLRDLAAEIVPDRAVNLPPPPVLNEPGIEWPDFSRIVKWLDAALAKEDVPLTLRFQRALHQLRALEEAQFDRIRGREADEVLAALARTAAVRLPETPKSLARPGTITRVFFGILILEFARCDTLLDLQSPNRHRLRMLVAQLRLIAGRRTPALRPQLKSVSVSQIEEMSGALPAEAEEILTRYFRVKVQTLHFCGQAHYHLPLVEGFHALALLYPVILWLARWLSVASERTAVTLADVSRALSLTDLHYCSSPRLGRFGFRWLTRQLARREEISRLCWWYSR